MTTIATGFLEDLLETEVHIGNINAGLLNRVIIDDIKIKDQKNKEMLTISRLAVKLEILPLFRGQISIANIQMFSFKLNTYQEHENTPLNCQFILDKLTSEKKEEKKALNLRINSILLRRGAFVFDKYYVEATPERFNPSHIHISDISTNIALKAFQEDSLNLAVKRLSMKEKSGLSIDNLRLKLTANPQRAYLTDFEFTLPNSQIFIDSISARYQEVPFSTQNLSWLKGLDISGRLNPSTINLKDLYGFEPHLKETDIPLHFQALLSFQDEQAEIDSFLLASENQEIFLNARFSHRIASGRAQDPTSELKLYQLNIEPDICDLLEKLPMIKISPEIQQIIRQTGNNKLQADARYHNGLQSKIILKNNCGQLLLSADVDTTKKIKSRIHTESFDLSILESLNIDLGKLSLNLFVQGTLPSLSNQPFIKDLQVSGKINNLEFKKYNYQNISLNIHHINQRFKGNISMEDPNGSLHLEGILALMNKNLKTQLKASVKNFSPNRLNLTSDFKNIRFSANLATDFNWKSIDDVNGNFQIANLLIQKDSITKYIDNISLQASDNANQRRLSLESDFLSAEVDGQFNIESLIRSLQQSLFSYLPSLRPSVSSEKSGTKTYDAPNNFTVRVNINNTDLLPLLLDIPVEISKPAYFYSVYRSKLNNLQVNCAIPEIHYGKQRLKNISLNCIGNQKQLQGNLEISKINANNETFVRMLLNAEQDTINTSIKWFSPENNIFNGNLDFNTSFHRDAQGKTNSRIKILPSQITLDNSNWQVHASRIDIAPKKVRIEKFLIEQPERHLEIGGIVSPNAKDSIIADLKGIDLQYIFNMIDFDAVRFGGHATGKVFATNLFKSPNIKAVLDVPDFTLNKGKMGSLNIFGKWDLETKSIYLNAMMNDLLNESITRVSGNITPGHTPESGIDLNIMANRTNIYFLNQYTAGIFTNLQGRATGHARVFGPFQEINLEGDLLVNEADMHIDILNTHYRLFNDSIILRPNNIWFRNADVYDDYGQVGDSKHYALVSGHLQHEHFTNLTYDIDINAQNILGYNQEDFGDEVFCGTAYASGKAHIYGKPGSLNVDLNIHPEEHTEFIYNLSSPDVLTDTPFIRFVNNSEKDSNVIAQAIDSTTHSAPENIGPLPDVNVSFQLDITPKATMKILMDARSGDYISLNGFGNMRATFYNKGKFQLYGTARINEGIYKLSLQDVIKKEFQITPGGTVTFGGDPAEAELNIQAVYTVPSVSLNDLNPQGTFTQSNVRVNCLMNLTGKARQPHISFDFDIPNVNEDEKQMVKTLISTEEEKNLQTIYLLGIGRFYSYNYNTTTQQNQSSLAMNSLLSSTLSGQLNEMLSNIIGSNNWNFGTNLSTGEDGWSDMDIEGLLSGKLMNNRLLINGNFGYKENAYLNKSSNFIGDFDVQWLLTKSGNIRLKGYSETNDRYFTKSSLTTQGIGIQLKKDFSSWRELFNLKARPAKNEQEEENKNIKKEKEETGES